MKQRSTESIIQEFIEAWGDRYSYESVVYSPGKRTKVKIICRKHGIFELRLYQHLGPKKKGCPRCGRENAGKINKVKRTMTVDEYIIRCRLVHQNRYDYSEVVLDGTANKIKIRCKEHGIFEQRASNHLQGSGCPRCAVDHRAFENRIASEAWVDRAKQNHTVEYDYSICLYTGSESSISIGCPKHGIFIQSAQHHARGGGCPKCAAEMKGQAKTRTNDQFIQEAQLVHGGRYDYRFVDYRGHWEHVDIVCNKHGVFKQTPTIHLSGS